MVDVGNKEATQRQATAEARVVFPDEAWAELMAGGNPKGGVIEPAKIAGIQAAKRTADLIPMCHPLLIDKIQIDIKAAADQTIVIRCTVRVSGKTGVEMEAMTGAAIAALTVYDMTKALSKEIRVENVCLLEKSGGKSGAWVSK
jgi:cyclic pyranopterin phosphate synthase